MRPVAGAVDRLLQRLGIARDVARADAVERWPDAATAVFGPDAAATRAVAIDGDTLIVAVPTAAWASEVRLREAEVVARLASASPRSGIRRVRTTPSR